jgi:hypothetical protein
MSGRPPLRATGAMCLAFLASALTASCSSGGTHTQSFSPSSPRTDHSTSTSDSPSSPSTSRSSTHASAIPTPTVTPSAQSAVDAAVALINAYNAASMNPAHADLARINQYLTGSALKLFDNQLLSMRRAGLAYRGQPANPRLKVAAAASATVALASCPLASASDPFTEYYVATGKPVSVTTRNPPPPYLQAITMRLVDGHWKMASLVADSSKTCKG